MEYVRRTSIMKSNLNFKIIDPNTKTQLENALVDIVVQQLIRKEDEKSKCVHSNYKTC